MRVVPLVIGSMLGTAWQSANALAFVLNCSQMVLGAGRTTPSLLKINWNGSVLTTTIDGEDDKPESMEEKIVESREIDLEPHKPGEVLFSFLTATHATKFYRYYTALHFTPSQTGGSLEQVLATTDRDGFLMAATSITYEQCTFESK